MIRSVTLILVVLGGVALAQEGPPKTDDPNVAAPPGAKPDTTTVERARTPFEALTEKLLGSASRAVRYDWRTKTVGLGVVTSGLAELNNFASARVGAFARIPYGDFLVELAATRAIVWGSDATDKLAQTPYRQWGRPNRFELDVNVDYVLAEGVVTPRATFIPPAQLVFSVCAGFRYLIYTETWKDLKPGEVALALISPTLQQKELDNLEAGRLPAMQLDKQRFGLLVGLDLDIYFQPGLFVSPRVMLALPIFSGFSAQGLGAWWELSARVGWML